ncbi:DUF4239 domain-containing protein [Kutzneria viridogrisea]|uniref:Uncharacterized protein n=2 Tax=Kutzneria TaxID=43356 RepID=W5WI03_9PSEU|nr:DUF4239 domain-containing protein [Kutzneria albida]AHI00381.1 hypothetical protein KALB_7023 [Kutzneria albida DSM 43870]MBA8925558.1 hypothetical protein [Kutzneria viridogrisea]
MDIYLQGILWVLGAAIVSGGLTALLHRRTSGDGRSIGNEATSAVFTIVAGLHAVLVAFVLISLFDATNAAHDGAQQEANALVAVTWAGDSLPDPTKSKIHELARRYATTVRDQEWPQMRQEQAVTGPGAQQLAQLHDAITEAASTDDEWLKDRKTEAANQLWTVYQARQTRLDAADGSGVNTVVWLALIIGALMSVAFAYLFGGTRIIRHVLTVALFAATITLVLYAIYQMQSPFTGGANVDPEAFSDALSRLS